MRRQTLAIVVVGTFLLAGVAGRAIAEVAKPGYLVGDFWSYATNLTEGFGFFFDGGSRVEVVRFGAASVQGSEVPIAELLVTGGGRFSGSFPGVGTATGTWSITGTEAWETGAWKGVRSFFRLTAEGTTGGPTPLPFTLTVLNETTRKTTADTWPWPVVEGTAGSWTAHWDVSQNITFSIPGVPGGWNASRYDAEYAIEYEHVRTERVTVPAGAFDANLIREEGPEGGSRLRWYAPRAGNDVLQEEFNASGGRIARAELREFAYRAGDPSPTVPWLIGVNVALGGVVVVLLGAIAVRRRRRHVDVWMPPKPGGERGPSKPLP